VGLGTFIQGQKHTIPTFNCPALKLLQRTLVNGVAFHKRDLYSRGGYFMKIVLIVLAFCSSAYTCLGCFGQWMSTPDISGSFPIEVIAFRAFALCSILCCIGALFRPSTSAVAAWLAALVYLLISWRLNASWVFRGDLIRFTLWTPLFLSVAALISRRWSSQLRNSDDGTTTDMRL